MTVGRLAGAGAIVLLLALVLWSVQKPKLRARLALNEYPHIVLITIDTLHVDYTGPYNPGITGTPNLLRFSSEGTLFERAYTVVPTTLPAHTDLMTGASPLAHGVMANGDLVPASATTLAEIFSDAGYRTAAFVSLGVLKYTFGLNQGFDRYTDLLRVKYGRWYRTADEVFESVRQWMDRQATEPFFIWVHYSDPHEPYLPRDAPPDTRLSMDGEIVGEWNLTTERLVTTEVVLPPGRHRLTWTSLREPRPDDYSETEIRLNLHDQARLEPFLAGKMPEASEGVPLRPSFTLPLVNDTKEPEELQVQFTGSLERPPASEVLENYPKEVEWVDRYVGRLWDHFGALGIAESTLWMIVSDHGEGLFRHDTLGHSAFVNEDQLRVMAIIRGPGVPRGRVVGETPVLMKDFAPTLLDLVGLDAPRAMEGVSMLECMRDGDCPRREEWWAYGFNHELDRLSAMAGYRWPYKWLWQRGRGRRAHQVDQDPWETRDIIEERPHPEEVLALSRRFRELRPDFAAKLNLRSRMRPDERHLEMMKSLGYLGGSERRAERP